jgi:hypothetical protein
MSNFKVPVDVLVSITTTPLLLSLLGGRVLTEILQDLGKASEEIFRGDRLPILNLSHQMPDIARHE